MPDNDRLKVVLHDAKLICRHKFLKVQDEFGEDHSDVVTVRKEIKNVFAHLDNPVLWMDPIPFDESDITERVLVIDNVNPQKMEDYLTHIRAFLTFLKDDLLKNALTKIDLIDVSDWNLKVLNALTKTMQKIDLRILFFKDNGTDLDQDAEFLQRHNHQADVKNTYEIKLRTNAINSTETDVIVINRLGDAISVQTEVEKFFKLHNSLTKFIEKKITPVA